MGKNRFGNILCKKMPVITFCITFLIFCIFPLHIYPEQNINPKSLKGEILYKTRVGNIKDAISLYRTYRSQFGHDDFELLQQIGFTTLQQGFRSKDPQEQLLAISGAGMARSYQLLYIFENGLCSQDPKIQLASLYFLSELHDDRADELIKKAMSSPFIIIRLEAAKMLAAKKDLNASVQIEGLMCKLDPILLPLFPPLFALAADSYSTSMLKRFLTSPNQDLRLATILSIIDYKRDDLLPNVRTLALHGGIAEQEAACFALGELKDKSSIKLLEAQSLSTKDNIKLAALISLYNLGRNEAVEKIEKLASMGNPFAITTLGTLPDTEELLFLLTKSTHITIRFNAGLALLKKRDPRCIPILLEILVKDSKDLSIIGNPSPGYAIESWKVLHATNARFNTESPEAEALCAIRESIISQTIDLPREDFFKLATALLDTNDPEIVPALIALVESLPCTESIEFLIKELHRAGAPLVRAYCNLALFRLKEPGPYAEFVYEWAKELKNIDLITFRPLTPRARGQSAYALTAGETSRLFVEVLTALANQKDPKGIDALLTAMSLGYCTNRYVLAGLLIRATE